ncbi:neutral zinc metallopeptidase [Nonomuraea sp. NPDC048916]|uniref:neutral zinc metallopeptidase n=1 Tax=Nonomuraea sp. NPDC048916 TaxID=3154232 RepID=UPI0033E678B4
MTGNGQHPPPSQGPGQPQRPPSLPWPPPGRRQPQPPQSQNPPYQHPYPSPPQGPPYQHPYPRPPQGPPYGQPYPQPPQGPPHGHPYPQPPQGPPHGQPPFNPGPQGMPHPQPQGWPPRQQQPPPPPPPMPPGQGQYGQWPPPRRGKSGMGVAGILGAVFGSTAALFVLIVIGSVVFKDSSRSETTTPVAVPTYTPYERPGEREPDHATEEPTRRPTQAPTRTATQDTTVTPPRQVRLDTTLKNNTLYRAGALPRVGCRAGDVSIFSHAQLKALILKTGKCMDRAWGPILREQGIDFSPPGYAIASGRGRGACGDYPSAGSMVPYYCPRNSTIYASTSAMARGNGNARGYGQIISWNGGIISMMAHEYGHHVQNLSGLMNSWWSQTLESGNRSGKLALSRRLELQATCFGGMWMRSVATSYPISPADRSRLFWFYGQVGDQPGYPRDHGSRANNNRWFRQGWEKNQTYQCNTWMAPSPTTS